MFGISSAMTRISNKDNDNGVDRLEDFVNNLSDLVSYNGKFQIIRTNFERTAKALVNINKELSNDKLKNILELRDAVNDLASDKMQQNFILLIQLLDTQLRPLFEQISTTLNQVADYSMQQQMQTATMGAMPDQYGNTASMTNMNSNTTNNTNVMQSNEDLGDKLMNGLNNLKDAFLTSSLLKNRH
jgi:hypothetical protein